MGQALNKFAPGNEEIKASEIVPVIEKCYNTYFPDEVKDKADFFRAVSHTIGEINKKLGCTQFRVPKIETLEQVYKKHHQGKGRALTEEDFRKILQDVIMQTGFSGIGTGVLGMLSIFGVPTAALFIKQGIIPRAVPNEIFIPIVTSATVFVLARLNKI